MSDKFYTNFAVSGDFVLYRGYDKGRRVHQKVKYKPTLFIPSNKATKYKTLSGQSVDKVNFDSIREARDFLERYSSLGNFKVYGNTNYDCAYISDIFKKPVEYDDTQIKISYIDIETSYSNTFPESETALEQIITITMKCNNNTLVFGYNDYKPKDKNTHYFKCRDERELFYKFLHAWKEIDADIISGWNCSGFDVPYIINRAKRLFGDDFANEFSPWGQIRTRKFNIQQQEKEYYVLMGVTILDYLDLYKKFVGQAENYKLNTIATEVLGEGKVEYEGSLKDLYKEDFEKFVEYNIQDVLLVEGLEKQKGLISMIIDTAYVGKVNFADVLTQTRLWDSIIFNYFRDNDLVVPQRKDNDKDKKFAGAFVKEPIPGKYNYVVSFDLDSLYPFLIRQFNISPETLVNGDELKLELEKLLNKEYDLKETLQQKNQCLAASGYFFRNDIEGFLGKILMQMYDQRKEYKRISLKAEEELQRIDKELERRGINV